jgi:hypothetical protein
MERHVHASKGWPVPNELPTLEGRSIDLFFAQKNLVILTVAALLLSVLCVLRVVKGEREGIDERERGGEGDGAKTVEGYVFG